MINNIAFNKTQLACDDFMMMAKQELTAFFLVVKEVFGAEQAQLSAEDWLHELEGVHCLPTSSREWSRLTMNVAARLAGRVNVSSMEALV